MHTEVNTTASTSERWAVKMTRHISSKHTLIYTPLTANTAAACVKYIMFLNTQPAIGYVWGSIKVAKLIEANISKNQQCTFNFSHCTKVIKWLINIKIWFYCLFWFKNVRLVFEQKEVKVCSFRHVTIKSRFVWRVRRIPVIVPGWTVIEATKATYPSSPTERNDERH